MTDRASATTNAATGGITVTDIARTMREIAAVTPPRGFDHYWNTFCGMPLIEAESDIRPVLQISDHVAAILSQSPRGEQVLRETNDYLLRTFGTRDHSVVARGSAYLLDGRRLVMRREDVALIRTITA